MSDITIDADEFGITVEKILEKLGYRVEDLTPEAVEEALKTGQKAWRRNARAVLSHSYSRGGWGKARNNAIHFKSGRRKGQVKSGWYGRTYKTGPYARSINHHMLQASGQTPEGEIGSPSMPGLAHLLEKGHGGPAPSGAKEHIASAADESFRDFESQVEKAIERALNEL